MDEHGEEVSDVGAKSKKTGKMLVPIDLEGQDTNGIGAATPIDLDFDASGVGGTTPSPTASNKKRKRALGNRNPPDLTEVFPWCSLAKLAIKRADCEPP